MAKNVPGGKKDKGTGGPILNKEKKRGKRKEREDRSR
jgi:hypothetical protein